MVEGDKPLLQGGSAAFHDGAYRQRGLVVAMGTLIEREPTCRCFIILMVMTAGTYKAIRPFDLKEIIGASLLCMKTSNEGLQANKFHIHRLQSNIHSINSWRISKELLL